ncbi:MAG: CoA transferase [Phenylobacterium sp.]|nr:CoA transferase [Phenylobacterium sp.]
MLEGLKVVEMASIAAGPVAAAMLAEWGAEVVKIEPLEGDRARYIPASLGIADTPFDADLDLHNRGKRSIALDLGRPESREIIEALVAQADVFITNMLPDKQVARGVDWGRLSTVNPKLVHASISGYGPSGPDAALRAIDHTAYWSRSGMAHLMTLKGHEPPPIRRAQGDRFAGVALVAGVLAAYIEAQRTGRGKVVETSLLRSAMFAIGTDLTMQLTRGRVGRSQPREANINPLHSFFPTRDDRWIAANLGNIGNVAGLGHPELLEDPRFADPAARRKNGEALVRRLDEIFRERTLAEWTQALQGADFSWAPVQTAQEVVEDPQALAAGGLTDVPLKSGEGSYRGVAMPAGFWDFDGTPDGLPRGQAPDLGEHTDAILAEIGYSAEQIGDLRGRNVVR